MFAKSIFLIAVLGSSCTAMEDRKDNLEILKEYFDSLTSYEQVECLSRLAQPHVASSTRSKHKNSSVHTVDDSLSQSFARKEDESSTMQHIKTFLLSFKSCFECAYRRW